jgi:hypothetical protein
MTGDRYEILPAASLYGRRQRGFVVDRHTGKCSKIYAFIDAEELLYWLRDRETGYQLTDEKMRSILE